MNEIVQAVLLGIVEGLTEFIPVSSTGHLIIFGDLIEFKGPRASTFEVFIQLGAILAIVFLYWDRFKSFLSFKSDESGLKGLEGIKKLFVASLPAFILGFLLHGYIKQYLFSSQTVAVALIFGGVVLIGIENRKKEPELNSLDEISYKDCFIVGLFQCLALWPGISRSGATIVGGLLTGMTRGVAAEFSFLLAVPIMAAATIYDLIKSFEFLTPDDFVVFAVGFIVSLIFALIAVKTFIGILKKYTFKAFGYYRIALGLLVILLLNF